MVNKKLNSILGDEVLGFIKELLDPNNDNMYEPEGLNPQHVKLFENVENLYQSSLDDSYWSEISKKFPEYNSLGTSDHKKAINHILNGIKTKHPDQDWNRIEKPMRDKISAGIS